MDITQRYWRRHDQTGAEVDLQLRDWDAFRYRYLRGAQHIDVLLTPTTPTAAPPLGAVDVDEFRFTVPASLTGSPAVALPAGSAADGRPLSVQLIGRPWEDHRLLAVAGLLERSGG
jgi:aspartyl-tRNA(Asn)/glutamyl-tRNA(Gln) amidotransferase subunit A